MKAQGEGKFETPRQCERETGPTLFDAAVQLRRVATAVSSDFFAIAVKARRINTMAMSSPVRKPELPPNGINEIV